MRTGLIFVFVVLALGGSARTAEACSCASQILSDRDEAASEFAAATLVFEGEVLAGDKTVATPKGQDGLSVIVFRVVHSYKGSHEETIQIFDAAAGSTCAFGQPEPGQKYFVYGYKRKDGKTYVEACTRTTGLESAGADIRYARGEPASKEDAAPAGEKWRLRDDPTLVTSGITVRGFVRRADGADIRNVFLTIWCTDENGRREDEIAAMQKVNEDGYYEVRYLSPGQYVVTAEDSLTTPASRFVGQYGIINLREAQTYSDVNLLLHSEPLGKVIIRVNAPQAIHDRVFVWLRDVNMDEFAGGAPYKFASTAQLDDKNIASFEGVPYGLYDVYVMLTGDNLARPSWKHDEVRVQLSGSHGEAAVELREDKQ
jgi:hypothetical protein